MYRLATKHSEKTDLLKFPCLKYCCWVKTQVAQCACTARQHF